ncbi:DUF5777 family beta-barrel protein [Algibacter pacificus]|uniref:DUF5777 family beta-barrel protein n=1 Tax=Algibacter pacificus TaxID=2599389 RepID=UPI0011CC31DA|nr:DUF5777 family beta-barrel protein [Algibacter pacificus]
MCNRIIVILLILGISGQSSAQDNLLDSLDTDTNAITVWTSFKGLQIVNLQSTKMVGQGDLYFVVSHRFGSLKDGINTFFGLDNATTKLGFIYGVKNWMSIGISRHTLNKAYELAFKYRLINQDENSLISLVGYNTIQINSQLDKDVYPQLSFQNRLSYTSQVLISRSLSKALTIEVVVSYIHKNVYDPIIENQKQFSIGGGGRFKLSKRLSLNAEYMYSNMLSFYRNPLSLGLDIETGGHVFQLLFTNSQGMTESSYLTNAAGDWGNRDVYFGFNLYRVF